MRLLTLLLLLPILSSALTDRQVLQKAGGTLPMLDSLISSYWPDNVCRSFIAGQIEQETCANFKKCWNSTTELKTDREYGFGLGQITIAFNKDGSERFNNFKEAVRKYHELADWRWADRFNIRAQLIYLLLECRASYNKWKSYFDGDIQIFAAVFVSYNAGSGTVLKRIGLCRITGDCNTRCWFGGLESIHLKQEEVLLYGRQLYARRNEYPHNIIFVRSKKYESFFQ